MRTSQTHGQVSPLYKDYDSWEPSNLFSWGKYLGEGSEKQRSRSATNSNFGGGAMVLTLCNHKSWRTGNRDDRPLVNPNPEGDHPITPGACCRGSCRGLAAQRATDNAALERYQPGRPLQTSNPHDPIRPKEPSFLPSPPLAIPDSSCGPGAPRHKSGLARHDGRPDRSPGCLPFSIFLLFC